MFAHMSAHSGHAWHIGDTQADYQPILNINISTCINISVSIITELETAVTWRNYICILFLPTLWAKIKQPFNISFSYNAKHMLIIA